MQFQHVTPPFRTWCGDQALAGLPRELARLDVERVMLVCDRAIVELHPDAMLHVEHALGDRLVGRFDEVIEHSPVASVERASDALRACEADGVVVVGGGSAVVTARAATILRGEGRDVRELCTRRKPDGRLVSPRLAAPKLPQWVLPSTPTSAYAKAGAAVRDPETGERLALFDPKARAQGVFFDPVLAATAPPRLVVSSGLNSFSMAVESLQATDDPLAVALLQHALSILARRLPGLVHEPSSDARLEVMVAALLCGQGSDYAGGGLAQALSHAAGPRSSVPNGVIEALLLPATMRFNAAVASGRLPAVLAAFGLGAADVAGGGVERAVSCVEEVLSAVDVPTRLRDAGLPQDALDDVVGHTLDDWAVSRVPRAADGDALRAILDEAF